MWKGMIWQFLSNVFEDILLTDWRSLFLLHKYETEDFTYRVLHLYLC